MKVLIGDGQVSFGDMVIKPNARKIRRVSNGKVLVGCAGKKIELFYCLKCFIFFEMLYFFWIVLFF